MPPFDVENNISDMMNLILSCLFYAPILPFAIPICLVGIIINLYASKCMLANLHKMPDDFGSALTTFFADLIPYTTIALVASYYIFSGAIYDVETEQAATRNDPTTYANLKGLMAAGESSPNVADIVNIINDSSRRPTKNVDNAWLYGIAYAYT